MSNVVRDRKTKVVYQLIGQELLCENCGNSENKDGFFPCDVNGETVCPTPDEWEKELYLCPRCGEIFKQVSLVEYLKAEYAQKAYQDLKFRMRDVMSAEKIDALDDKLVRVYLDSDHFIKWLKDEFHVHTMTYDTLDGGVEIIVFDEYDDEDGLREVRLGAYLELAKVGMDNFKSEGYVEFGKTIEHRVETLKTKDRIIITREIFMNI